MSFWISSSCFRWSAEMSSISPAMGVMICPGRGGVPDRRVVLDGIDVLPDDRLFRRHFEDRAVGARADERVAVGQPLGAGDEGRIRNPTSSGAV